MAFDLRGPIAGAAGAAVLSMAADKFMPNLGITMDPGMINPHLAAGLSYYAESYVGGYIPTLFADSPQMQLAFNQYITATAVNFANAKRLNLKAGVSNAIAVYLEPIILGFVSPLPAD